MPSPIVASSTSSAPELWRSQPPASLSFSHDRWDDRDLNQALALPSSSTQSLARALSRCLAGRSAWQTSDPQNYAAVIRASQQLGGAFLQQKQEQEVEKSDPASPMSNSDLKESSGSPLNSPPGSNSNSTTGMPFGDNKPPDATAFLPQQQNGDILGSQGENAPRTAAMTSRATPVKFEGESNVRLTAKATPSALSAHAALGSAVAKVNKRRSRATNKVPITVLSADTSNFRAMVQKLTGIPVSPAMQPSRLRFWSNQDASVLKPHPTRPCQSIQGLPTLDTSAYLLLDGGSTGLHPQRSKLGTGDNSLQNFSNAPYLKPLRQQSDSPFKANLVAGIGLTRTGAHVSQSGLSIGVNSDLKPSHSSLVGSSDNFGASLPGLWDATERLHESFPDKINGQDAYNGLVGGADLFNVRQSSSFDNLMTGNDRSDYDMSSRMFNSVDSWLSSDIPNKSEMTRTA